MSSRTTACCGDVTRVWDTCFPTRPLLVVLLGCSKLMESPTVASAYPALVASLTSRMLSFRTVLMVLHTPSFLGSYCFIALHGSATSPLSYCLRICFPYSFLTDRKTCGSVIKFALRVCCNKGFSCFYKKIDRRHTKQSCLF